MERERSENINIKYYIKWRKVKQVIRIQTLARDVACIVFIGEILYNIKSRDVYT